MISLAQKKADRWAFMKELYRSTRGDATEEELSSSIGDRLGFDRDYANSLVDYLKDEHLLKHTHMGGWIGITHRGIVEVEQSEESPNTPTEHFPAASTVTHNYHFHAQGSVTQGTGNTVSQMTNSGNTNSTTVGGNISDSTVASGHHIQQVIGGAVSDEDRQWLGELLDKIEALLPALEERPKKQLTTQAQAIREELKETDPDPSIINHTLEGIVGILVKARNVMGDHAVLMFVIGLLNAHGYHVPNVIQ